jgi:hypothetical protein
MVGDYICSPLVLAQTLLGRLQDLPPADTARQQVSQSLDQQAGLSPCVNVSDVLHTVHHFLTCCLPIYFDFTQSDGPFGRQGCWGPVTRIKSALRGALYGAPLAAVTSQSDALKQELVAAALLAAESSDALVMHLLMQEADQVAAGKVGLYAHMPQIKSCDAGRSAAAAQSIVCSSAVCVIFPAPTSFATGFCFGSRTTNAGSGRVHGHFLQHQHLHLLGHVRAQKDPGSSCPRYSRPHSGLLYRTYTAWLL